MSEGFYEYLAEKTIEYFTAHEVPHGKKYILHLENRAETRAYCSCLKRMAGDRELARDFTYRCDDQATYSSFSLEGRGSEILVAAQDGEDVTLGFLTTLRNIVGKNDYENYAVLMVCYDRLDSIDDGTENLRNEGMPFHFRSVIGDIEEQIRGRDFTPGDRAIIKNSLEEHRAGSYQDNTTLYEYQQILDMVAKKRVDPSDYRGLGLFFDPELPSITEEDRLTERICDNKKYYEMIDTSLKYGEPEKDLCNDFQEKFISDLTGRWKNEEGEWDGNLNYAEISRARKRKIKNDVDLTIDSNAIQVWALNESGDAAGELDRFVKNESDTKLKTKYKHLLIFNPKGHRRISIEVNANKELTKLIYEIPKEDRSYVEVDKSPGRRKVAVQVRLVREGVNFGKVDFELNSTNEKFKISFCVVNIDQRVLSDLETRFLIKIRKRQYVLSLICSADSMVCFNKGRPYGQTSPLAESMEILYHPDRYEMVDTKNDSAFGESGEVPAFFVISDGILLPLCFEPETARVAEITGITVERRKLYEKCSFLYQGNNKLVCRSGENYATEAFRINLMREEKMLRTGYPAYEAEGETLKGIELELPEEVRTSYQMLLQSLKDKGVLPSLAYYDEELRSHVGRYVEAFRLCLEQAPDERPLEPSARELLRVGTISDPKHEQILLTALHPLNLLYRLELSKEKVTEELREDMMKRLSQANLLPYITDRENRLYRVVEQSETPEWTYYSRIDDRRDDGSKKYVSSVICDKIEEFEEHFSYLFPFEENPMRINVMNMGDCREVLAGILKYYGKRRKNARSEEELRPLTIYVYNYGKTFNYFESFTGIAHGELAERLRMILGGTVKKNEIDELIGVASRKIRFFEKDIGDEELEYAHLTFYEMVTDEERGKCPTKDLKSSVMMNGLQSGVSSEYYGWSFRTGFGTKYTTVKNDLMSLTRLYNSLYVVNGISDPYLRDQAVTTQISRNDLNNIEKAYECSNWVTFIDPKVDLNFFKKGENNKNVIIIHYSDQYTTTSGYDAITVTRKCGQYENILKEALNQHGVDRPERYTRELIDLFNAVNGNWLLNLVSSKNNYFGKEKISLLSAVKLLLAYFHHSEIVWVPVSLEEILRVSGAVGLPKSEGIFSIRNIGVKTIGETCDDILMVGIRQTGGVLQVYFHPVEVKIGEVSGDTLNKAAIQVKRTCRLIKETVNEAEKDSLKVKFYRNFLMQLVIISAEKMDLYQVWQDYNWKRLTESEIRERLLNDEFTISTELEEVIGEGTVVSFKRSAYNRENPFIDGISYVTMLYQDGFGFLVKNVTEIQNLLEQSTIDRSLLLETQLSAQEEQGEAFAAEEAAVTEAKSERSMEIVFGTDAAAGEAVYWRPNDSKLVMHLNTGIIGTMGTGKTQFTKSLVTQLAREGRYNVGHEPAGILIFDYKGDYNSQKADFVEAVDAKVLEVYHLPYNPFSLSVGGVFKPLLPLHVADTFKDTLSRAYGLGVKQSSLLSDLIMEAYERKGISSGDPATWTKLPPTFSDVYRLYAEKEEIKKDDSLYSALSELNKYQIFEPDASKAQSLYDLIQGVTVVNLAGQNQTLQNLIVAITLDLFYAQMQSHGHSSLEGTLRQIRKIILVDEADNFLRVGFSSLRNILKEGREYGVGTILSTQFLKHFDTEGEDYSPYILTWVVHKISDFGVKDIRNIFAEDQKERLENLCNEIKRLQPHESFVKIGNDNQTRKIRDLAFFELVREE